MDFSLIKDDEDTLPERVRYYPGDDAGQLQKSISWISGEIHVKGRDSKTWITSEVIDVVDFSIIAPHKI